MLSPWLTRGGTSLRLTGTSHVRCQCRQCWTWLWLYYILVDSHSVSLVQMATALIFGFINTYIYDFKFWPSAIQIITFKKLPVRKEIHKRWRTCQLPVKFQFMSLLHGKFSSCRWRFCQFSDIPNIPRRHLRISRRRFSHVEGPLKSKSWILYPVSVLGLGAASWIAYENIQPFRHTVLAGVRCSRVAGESQKELAWLYVMNEFWVI